MATKDELDFGAAARSHLAAAERAQAATLWRDAVDAYEACLSLVSAADDRLGLDEAALLTALGSCYWNLAEARTAWRTLRRAITLYRERGDAVGAAQATVEILRIWGPPERHRTMAQEALDALGDADAYLRARLLLRLRWFDENPDEKFNEALAIGEQHGFKDVVAMRTERDAWRAADDGRVDDAMILYERAHDAYAGAEAHEPAAGVLRHAGFMALAFGRMDQGEAYALRTVAYARSVHLSFSEQLALMDAAGAAFARADFERCGALLDESPSGADFRADLYCMWMLELAGDTAGALALMVDPQRGGGATTAQSQIDAAAAGVLFRAGRRDAARQALESWARTARDGGSLVEECPALVECIFELGDDQLVRDVHESFTQADLRSKGQLVYATLQGRALAPARGAVALRLGLVDEAERRFRDGLAWCEREACPIDAGLCLRGLGAVAAARGDDAEAAEYAGRARTLFEAHGARLYLTTLASA